MDPRQPQHPFTRPPERSFIHNPNHQQSAPQPSQPQQPFPGYAPPTSQPQLPIHVPFSADPYPTARRDPFLPSAAQQHVRRSSYGMHGGEGVPQGQGERERHAGWGNTGTNCGCGPHIFAIMQCGATREPSMCWIQQNVSIQWHTWTLRVAPQKHHEDRKNHKPGKECRGAASLLFRLRRPRRADSWQSSGTRTVD
jgi:hypothetical protein